MRTKKEVLATSKSAEICFKDAWPHIAEDVANAFRMTDEEKDWLRTKNVAQLIGALPFLAGCEDAERTAVTHLGTYILSIRETKHYYNAHEGDNENVFERLRLISNFKGGDKAIIKRGMSLLAMNMIFDYNRDMHIDAAIGKYNPIADKALQYGNLRKELLHNIRSIECKAMDDIMGEVDTEGFWM